MERYILVATKSTPYVDLDPEENKLIFCGQSYPENAYKLYEPIYQWVQEYFKVVGNAPVIVDFTLSYINTSSTKCILTLLEMLNDAYLNGINIRINWYFDEENGFDYEMGCDFKEDIVIPFEFVSINSEE